MTLRRDAKTGVYSADLRDRSIGRLHLSLRSRKKAEAHDRYAALRAFVREGDAELISWLRSRRITIEAIARLHRDRKPFGELRAARRWPELGDAIEQYLAWMEDRDRAANSITNTYYALQDAVTFFGAPTPLTAITEERVQEWRRSMDGLAANTVRGKLVRFSAMYTWLQESESKAATRAKRPAETLYNPVDRSLLPAEGAPRHRFLSDEEVQALMAATPAYYALAVALGILAGLRYDEMRTLERSDLDMVNGLVLVRAKLMAAGVTWKPKSKASERAVPLCAALLPLAEAHLRDFSGERWLYQTTSKQTDGPWDYDYLHKAFKRIVTDAELTPGKKDPEGVTYHTLRHTFASHLVMAGVDLFTVARLMGHANTREVERVYAHLSPRHREQAIALLGEALAKAFGPRLVAEAEA